MVTHIQLRPPFLAVIRLRPQVPISRKTRLERGGARGASAAAVAPGSSAPIVAGVVATGVPVPVGGQVLSSSKMLSVIAQFASATPPVFVTWNVIWLTPFASCVAHCFSIATLGTPHTSLSVAVIFFGCDGFAGSTEPTTSHVTETVLHAFVASPLTLAFTVVIIPCGSDATPGTVTAVDG